MRFELLQVGVAVAAMLCACDDSHEEAVTTTVQSLAEAPANAIAAPADYNGDGAIDFALKGNGTWYVDIGHCPPTHQPETACSNAIDDDFDGMVNDGCPASGSPESLCDDWRDSDGDLLINDGCAYCQEQDVFGDIWDFGYTYPVHAGASATPVPADYGRSDGAVDTQHRADIAVKDSATGAWAIDFADNGFGAWDLVRYGYGFSDATPVPADYDGDGRADLAVKTTAGAWLIDYAYNGFNGWDPPNAECTSCTVPNKFGGSDWIPVPADYNGDGRADLAVKTNTGWWYIDESNLQNTGFGGSNWDKEYCCRGDGSFVPVPFNYDPWRDNKADLAVKDALGGWYIDYAYNQISTWDTPVAGPTTAGSPIPMQGYGGNWTQAIPGDYDGDGLVDISVKDSNGHWYVDLGNDGWFGWNTIPGTNALSIDNTARPLYDPTKPHILATTIRSPFGVVTGGLTVGVRYIVQVDGRPGTGTGWDDQAGSIEVNDRLNVPSALQIPNRTGSTHIAHLGNNSQGDPLEDGVFHRYFAITCREPGNFPLGFQVRSHPPYELYPPFGGKVVNRDYGIRVACISPSPSSGISGYVMERVLAPGARRYVTGAAIQGAKVEIVTGGAGSVFTDAVGYWQLPANGGPIKLRISAAGFSDTVVVNLTVPSGGVRVDASLEKAFPALPGGITYTTYLDYSRGRTLMHTVEIDRSSSVARIGKSTSPPNAPCGVFNVLGEQAPGSYVMTNSMWWTACSESTGTPDNSVGYAYGIPATGGTSTYLPSDVFCNQGSGPSCLNANVYLPEVVATAEAGSACANGLDDDSDGRVNDGCPVAGLVSPTSVSASSIESASYPAAYAIDGSSGTRWSSTFSDPQWLQLNLGAPRSVYMAKLQWETAFASKYRVEFWNGLSWWDVVNVTNGDGGLDQWSFDATATFFRMYGTQRATGWGYSLWEMQLYATNVGSPESGTSCVDAVDNDNDGRVNDGCPATGVATPLYPDGTTPMLAIAGQGTSQQFSIMQTPSNFLNTSSPSWRLNQAGQPIWDDNSDGLSDFSSAAQIGNPPLVRNGVMIAGGDFLIDSRQNYDYAYARTSIGLHPNGRVFLVIVDGENIQGGNGATANQLAHFYKDTLGVTNAMGFDSALSTMLYLKEGAGMRRINTLTGEDCTWGIDPYTEDLPFQEAYVPRQNHGSCAQATCPADQTCDHTMTPPTCFTPAKLPGPQGTVGYYLSFGP